MLFLTWTHKLRQRAAPLVCTCTAITHRITQVLRRRQSTNGVSLVLFSFGLIGLTLVSWGTYLGYTQLVDARESVNALVSDALDQAILLPQNQGGAYINEQLNGKDLQLAANNVAPVAEQALQQSIGSSTIQSCGQVSPSCPFTSMMSHDSQAMNGQNSSSMSSGSSMMINHLCSLWQQYAQSSQAASVTQSCNTGTNGGAFQWTLPPNYMQGAHIAGPITVDAIQVATTIPSQVTLFGHTQSFQQPVIAAQVWIPVQVTLFAPLHWNSVIQEAVVIPLTGRQAPAQFLNFQN